MEKTTSKTRKDKRNRFKFDFWLDVNKDDELLLAEAIDDLKAERKWRPTVKQSLTVFLSLMAGNVAPLLEHFPWIEDHFRAKFEDEQPPPTLPSDDFQSLLRYQAMILDKLDKHPAGTHLEGEPQPLPGLSDLETLGESVFVEPEKTPEQIRGEAMEARQEFAAGVGDLFADDDDDDLFDD